MKGCDKRKGRAVCEVEQRCHAEKRERKSYVVICRYLSFLLSTSLVCRLKGTLKRKIFCAAEVNYPSETQHKSHSYSERRSSQPEKTQERNSMGGDTAFKFSHQLATTTDFDAVCSGPVSFLSVQMGYIVS